MDKESPDWYLARSIGQVIHTNPDLQTPALLARFPKTFATPMEEMLWLPSIKWLLTHDTPIPEVRSKKGCRPGSDRGVTRSLGFALSEATHRCQDRQAAAGRALGACGGYEGSTRILASRPVLQKVKPDYMEADVPEVAAMSAGMEREFEYFKTWVAPEFTKTNREDELACLGCHARRRPRSLDAADARRQQRLPESRRPSTRTT